MSDKTNDLTSTGTREKKRKRSSSIPKLTLRGADFSELDSEEQRAQEELLELRERARAARRGNIDAIKALKSQVDYFVLHGEVKVG